MNRKDRVFPDFWTAHESTMHINYLSVSIKILNLIFIHTTTIMCMGIVTATAGLWAAKGL